jgi:hypothetical protein
MQCYCTNSIRSRLIPVSDNKAASPVQLFVVLLGWFFDAAVESKRYRIGGAKRDRTADPLRARQVLSQLSYSPGCVA